jgi:hypothetical protein
MAHGQLKKIATPKVAGTFIVYKVQPKDKSLKQIALEQLLDERLADKIFLDRETKNDKGLFYDEIPPNTFDPRWTLLLPPSEFAAFTITINTTICKTPNGALLDAAKVGEKFFYKRSTVQVSGQTVWAEVSRTNPQRYSGIPYWICVKNRTPNTNPIIESPS